MLLNTTSYDIDDGIYYYLLTVYYHESGYAWNFFIIKALSQSTRLNR